MLGKVTIPLLLVFFFFTWGYPKIILSEYMGNPKAQSDYQGEFIELINLSNTFIETDSLLLILNQDTLVFKKIKLAAKEIFLICRDSLSLLEWSLPCAKQWPKLTLPNTKESELVIKYDLNSYAYNLNIPQPGNSWENTLNDRDNFQEFIISPTPMLTGDFGTPGRLPSQTNLILQKDLALESFTYQLSPQGIHFQYVLVNKGQEDIANVSLQINLDDNWDNQPGSPLFENVINQVSAGDKVEAHIDYEGNITTGVYQIQIGPDQNLNNNSKDLFVQASPSLILTEVCPAPPEGNSEWVEIKNTGNKPLALTNIALGNTPLFITPPPQPKYLPAGELLILVQDSASFQKQFGQLSLNIWEVSPWNILKNSGGDTVVIHGPAGATVDSMTYPSLSGHPANLCYIRDINNPGNWVPSPAKYTSQGSEAHFQLSPGYEEPPVKKFSWSLSQAILNIADPSQKIHMKFKIPYGDKINITIFDLNGFPVKDLAKKLTGNRDIHWDGKDNQGQNLPIGPYILWIQKNSRTLVKKPLILARPL